MVSETSITMSNTVTVYVALVTIGLFLDDVWLLYLQYDADSKSK